MRRFRKYGLFLLVFLIGLGVGGYLFSDTQPRSFTAINRCQTNCLSSADILGLLSSIGIQRFPSLVPNVVMETDKTLVIEHPRPQARVHYVIVPKKDIRNITDLDESDREYLIDMFAVIQQLAEENDYQYYALVSNGPGYQDVTYLHFHMKVD